MREILFRGKRIRQNDEGIIEWVYGHYYDVYGVPNIEQNNKSFDVDPETVGQFTGLIDKNGVKIFEGDIVTIPKTTNRKYSIDYVADLAMYVIHDNSDMGNDKDFTAFFGMELEVIGNIYDNLELLNND